jgi:hypothetical protein
MVICRMGQGVCHCWFCRCKWPVLHLWRSTSRHHLDYPKFKANSHWHSIDTHFQDWAGSMSVLFLPLKVASTLFMDVYNQSQLWLHKIHGNHCCCSIDAHFQNGPVTMSHCLHRILPIRWLYITVTKSLVNNHLYKTKDCWHFVNRYFYNIVVMSLLVFFSIHTAKTVIANNNYHITS